ncbi:MAG TPA: RdgB/HAM1 family non-canonical purine NTP pyrophosphatase [Anaerolineaceae bacterium]
MPDLLIASENPGKLIEIQAILGEMPIHLVMPASLGLRLGVAETGETYAENAALKARAYAQAGQLLALGDDSGLEVAALDGRPGLHSHRFTGNPDATDADRRTYLLSKLAGKPLADGQPGWPAVFHCAVAIVTPQGDLRLAAGACPGFIIPEERGTGGFGYDPLFLIPEYGQTMAELGPDVKNRISHRARALQAAIPILREMLNIA